MIHTEHNGLRFVIEEDNLDVGAYLYVFDKGKCVHDTLQNDIATCKEVAHDDYGVPREQWIESPT